MPNNQIPVSENGVVFCRRKSDGKFYRGAYFWMWAKSWRNAAVARRSFWDTWIIGRLKNGAVVLGADVELVSLNDIEGKS